MFDPRAAANLKPREHITIEAAPGLRLEASATTRTWTYRYKSPVDGRMRQVKIAAWPATALPAAMGEWDRLRKMREQGLDPSLEKKAAKQAKLDQVAAQALAAARPTVKQVCDAYISGYLKTSRKTKGWTEVDRMFATMLPDHVAAKVAEEVTRKDAFALIESHASIPVQASKLRCELGAVWDRALDAGTLPENTPNWWRQILRGKLKSRGRTVDGKARGTAKRALSPAEAGKLINWFQNFSRVQADVLVLYLWTLCRGSEIVAMHAAEITEEDSGTWWTIPKAKTKNAHIEDAGDLRVPLVGRAREVVRRRLKTYPGGYLFPSHTDLGHVEQKAIGYGVWLCQPYCKVRPELARARLEVTHWTPHDLRRTGRTALAALGCPDDLAEAVLGHVLPGVKGIYNVHKYDAERLTWLTRLDQHWEALASAD